MFQVIVSLSSHKCLSSSTLYLRRLVDATHARAALTSALLALRQLATKAARQGAFLKHVISRRCTRPYLLSRDKRMLSVATSPSCTRCIDGLPLM